MSRRGGMLAGARAVGPAGTNRQGAAPPPGSTLAQLGNTAAPGGPRPVGAAGNWGDAYGSLGLPRPPSVFTDAAFSPYPPILAVPINEPNDTTGQVPTRREEYRVGWNLPVGQPGSEGLKLADFNTLRSLSELYSVARACIQYLKSEITSLEWDILPTKDAAKAMRNDQAKMRDFGERRGKAIKFFKRPDPDYFSWQSWLSDVLEEMLTYDALSIVLRPKWGRGLGRGLLGSDLDSLNLVNGPTIRPLYDVLGGTPRPPAVAYQQYLYGVPRSDWMSVMTGRDVDEAGLSQAEFKAFRGSQLLYLREVPRRHTPYGMPPVERALVPIMSGLARQGFQQDYYKEGTVPAVYISPGGDLSPNQIRELQDALNGIAGDPAFHHKVIVLPSGSTVQPQRPAALADAFDEIVMAQTCMGFGVAPMAIGIMPKVSATASPGAANQMAKMTSSNQEKGSQKPRLIFLANICDFILGEVCGQPDMRFVFDGMEEEEDEETKTNLIVNQLSHALLTVDEGRDELGRQPFGTPKSTEPGVFTPTGFVTLAEQAAQQEQQAAMAQQMQANMGGQMTPPGAKPGGGEGDEKGPEGKAGPSGGGGKPPAKPGTGGAKKPEPKPGEAAQAHTAAAQATIEAQKKPAPNTNKAATTDAPPATATQAPPAPQSDPVDDALAVAATAFITKQVIDAMLDLYLGQLTLLMAVEHALAAITNGYLHVMTAASRAAAVRFGGAPLDDHLLDGLASQRAETQRQYLVGMARATTEARRTGASPTWLPQRASLYGQATTPAWHQAYGQTVQADHPDYTIIWRLGDTEHCDLCRAREDHEYTFETLPGWPGDGGFGALCEGGQLCGCHLDYMEGDRVVDQAFNNARPAAAGYYQQQLADITVARQAALDAKDQFLVGLLNEAGGDGVGSVQSRAMDREKLRRLLAGLANDRIRSTGGYGGVSVEPQDIPAKLIASLLPQYGSTHLQDVPITAINDAVESMFRGKYAAADLTKDQLHSLMLGVVAHAVKTTEVAWPSLRAVTAELEALARHLTKGRPAADWHAKSVTRADVADLAALLETGGVTRAEAVKAVLGRRYVSLDGTVVEEADQEDEPPSRRNAAGWGGPILVPHDADGIQHDLSDLKPRPALKGAADHSDPNEVDAEHVINQLRRNYPDKALGWMKGIRWIGPVKVPTDRFDTDDEGSWAASHETDRVDQFAKEMKQGQHLHPIVAVQEPGEPNLKIIDGHHRYEAYKKRGKKALCYIGFVDSNGGPWDETHVYQVHQGSDLANKVGPKGFEHGWRFVGVAPGKHVADPISGEHLERVKSTAAEWNHKNSWETGGVDRTLHAIATARGFDQHPKIGKIDESRPVLYRGFSGAMGFGDEGGNLHQFTHGDYRVGDNQMYGNGIYTGTKPFEQYGTSIRMQLDPHAKVADYDELDGELERLSEPEKSIVGDDPGKLAALRGYDAYKRKSMVVVLNRGALTVESPTANKATTLSKTAAGYRDGADVTHRCRNCSMFLTRGDDEVGRCTLVQGDIRTDAVCDHWEAADIEKIGVKAWLPDLIKAGEGDEAATERLRHYWTHGEGGTAKVRWGEPGDFDRCVRHVGRYMENPQGYCAERHHDALGIWPATHAKEERDAAKASGTPGLTKRSGMVSIDLPEGTVPALPNGVGDHHITLAYLGSNVSDEQLEAALNLVRAVAPQHEPLTVRLGGIASFPPSASSDGLVPAYVPVTKSQELSSLRETIGDLDQSGRPEWHPHVTLAYLNEGDPLPPPVPATEFQAGHVSVHVGDRVWRVPLGAAPVRKVYGVSLIPGGFIPKIGAEGYIHGFICVRPPCGKAHAATVTRDPSNGKVYLGAKGTGEYIGKIVKNSDGTFTARHNGHIIGGGKTLLQGKYANHDQAARALGHYHSLRALEQAAHDQGDHEAASHLGAAATAHASGDAEQALFNAHQAHGALENLSGGDLKEHVAAQFLGMGGHSLKPATPSHPTHDDGPAPLANWEKELMAADDAAPSIPKPSASSHPGKFISPHDVNEHTDAAGVVHVTGKATGEHIGTYHHNAVTGHYVANHKDGTAIGGNANQDEALDALLAYHNDKTVDKPAVPSKPPGLQVVDSIQMGKVEPQDLSTEQLQAAKQWMHQDAVKDAKSYINGPNPEKDAVEALNHPDHANNDTWTAVNAELKKRGALTYLPGEVTPAKKTAATPPKTGSSYETIGAISTSNVSSKVNSVTGASTVQAYKDGAYAHIGTVEQNGAGDWVGTHADGMMMSPKASGDEAEDNLIAYHNSHYGDGSSPTPTPTIPSLKPAAAPYMTAPKPATHEVEFSHADLKPNADDTGGDIVDTDTNTKLGTYTGSVHGDIVATHNDGTMYTGSPGYVLSGVVDHHNWTVSQAVKPASAPLSTPSGPAPVTSAPWKKAGQVNVADLSLKQNGDVVHKPTKTVIGHVDKQPNTPKPGTTTFTATHADGTQTHVGVYKGNAMATIALHHNAQLSAPSATGKKPYESVGQVKASDLEYKNTNGGTYDLVHKDTGTVIGSVVPHEEIGKFDAVHADGKVIAKNIGLNAATNHVISHHNDTYGGGGTDLPPKPGSVTTPPKLSGPTPTVHGAAKPWDKAGTEVTPDDVTAKLNGDVVDKETKAKIGVVYKTPDSYWTAAHQDGQGFAKYVKKSDALEKLTAYHNQSVAIDKGVKKGDPKLKDLDLLPQGAFYQAKLGDAANGYHVTDVNNGKDYGTLVPDDGGFKATLANGTTFHIPSADATKAKYNFLYAHNQAVGVAIGQPVKKLTAHPAADDGIGFSEHTEVGAKAAPLTTASAGVSHSAAAAASTSVGHVKHTLAADHTVTETAAIKKYTGSWYATINKAIAAKQLAGDQVPAGVSGAALHHALNKTELAHDTTLHRGIHDAHAMLGPVGSKVGTVGIQHSFMSTSTKPSVAKSFGHGGVVLTIHAPKGAKAMNVVNLSHYSGESEVLFQHGTMYKVNSDEIGSDGLRRADITIVGLSAKDGDHTVYPKMGASGE